MLGAPAIDEQGGRRVALTQRLIPADLDDLRGVELTAHQFQQWVGKREEARVLVIGSQVFAVAIRAGSAIAGVDSEWIAAVRTIPRHALVPVYYEPAHR